MKHHTPIVIIVIDDLLPQLPVAFQQYVKTYFSQTVILGYHCWYATCSQDMLLDPLSDVLSERRAFAPLNSEADEMFTEGLPDKVTISDWIKSNQTQFGLYQLHHSWWEESPKEGLHIL